MLAVLPMDLLVWHRLGSRLAPMGSVDGKAGAERAVRGLAAGCVRGSSQAQWCQLWQG